MPGLPTAEEKYVCLFPANKKGKKTLDIKIKYI